MFVRPARCLAGLGPSPARGRRLMASVPNPIVGLGGSRGAWAEDAFCCMDYGFMSRCGTCPFPADRKPMDGRARGKIRPSRPDSKVQEALKILGLEHEDATNVAAIKAAMRQQAKKWHPDNNDAKNALECNARFVEARDAFCLLMERAAGSAEQQASA